MSDLDLKITGTCRLTKRPIGRILVDGEFVSGKELERALEEQTRNNELLGEVLVRMGLVDPIDLKVALSVQHHLASLEDAVKAAAGVRELLGTLLLRARRITGGQLDLALGEQKRTGEKLGKVMVRLGLLTGKELAGVLTFQQNQNNERQTNVAFRLGEILVAAGYITREQLEEALRRQKLSQKKLGEVLVEAGYAEPHHIEHGLKLQAMLLTAALVATLSLSLLPGSATVGEASASSTSAKMTVTASVLPRASLNILYQTRELVVTNADIARGYVEVASASRIEVRNNSRSGFLLAFEGLRTPFREIIIQGLGKDIQINSGTGWVPQAYTGGVVVLELGYRFILGENAEPGTYAWPLSISVQPL